MIFWLPYNTNIEMGKEIEDIMEDRKKRELLFYRAILTLQCFPEFQEM